MNRYSVRVVMPSSLDASAVLNQRIDSLTATDPRADLKLFRALPCSSITTIRTTWGVCPHRSGGKRGATPAHPEVIVVATQPRGTARLADLPSSAPERFVKPRRGLPGSRAVVGGLLIAVAAVGVFAAWSGAGKNPTTRYIVASRTIAAGTVLDRADLTTVAIDLPDAVAGRSFSNIAVLEHAVTLGPLEAGELVQSGNVLPGRRAKRRPELSFGIDAERAVAGTLRAGDRIDILVTYGTGAGSVTQVVSTDAVVLAVDGGNRNGLSDSRRQVLSVALASSDDILGMTNAARAGELTVARASGVTDRPATQSFQPDVPESAGGNAAASSSTTSVPRRNP